MVVSGFDSYYVIDCLVCLVYVKKWILDCEWFRCMSKYFKVWFGDNYVIFKVYIIVVWYINFRFNGDYIFYFKVVVC